MGKDILFKKIDYLTIIITGRTGVGKSALINALLKEYLAREDMKDIVTTKPCKYESKNVTFLKLIDTRGIEIGKEYGIHNISEEIIKIINNPNELEKYKKEKGLSNFIEEKKPLNCNDYVQCVFYCVTGSSIESEEIDFINKIKLQKNKVPIIIVYTMSQDEDNMEKMKNQVYDNFKDIPYIEVLSKDGSGIKSFVLDKLINKNIEQCKHAFGSRTFDEMRQEINKTIIKNLKKKNTSMKNIVINESI